MVIKGVKGEKKEDVSASENVKRDYEDA